MDTSETYIGMCEGAREIQALKPDEDSKEGRDDHSYSSLFYLPVDEVFGLLHWDNDEGHWMIGDYHDNTDRAIWLPRQDQLQAMIKDKYFQLGDMAYFFWSWIKSNIQVELGLSSMEQLWLAFVMSEKFEKIWDGGKWQPDGTRLVVTEVPINYAPGRYRLS